VRAAGREPHEGLTVADRLALHLDCAALEVL
jgi:hypothetical protein